MRGEQDIVSSLGTALQERYGTIRKNLAKSNKNEAWENTIHEEKLNKDYLVWGEN